jgi:hypothetical protein
MRFITLGKCLATGLAVVAVAAACAPSTGTPTGSSAAAPAATAASPSQHSAASAKPKYAGCHPNPDDVGVLDIKLCLTAQDVQKAFPAEQSYTESMGPTDGGFNEHIYQTDSMDDPPIHVSIASGDNAQSAWDADQGIEGLKTDKKRENALYNPSVEYRVCHQCTSPDTAVYFVISISYDDSSYPDVSQLPAHKRKAYQAGLQQLTDVVLANVNKS